MTTSYLTPDEAAKRLCLSRRQILSWARLGRIHGAELFTKKLWRFRAEDLDVVGKIDFSPRTRPGLSVMDAQTFFSRAANAAPRRRRATRHNRAES